MREADHARPCGTDAVLPLPGVTGRYAPQPGVTAPAIWQNEPTAGVTRGAGVAGAAVDTGLRQLTQVDAGLRPNVIVENEPTVDVGVDTGLRQLTPVDAMQRNPAIVQNEPTAGRRRAHPIWKNEPVSPVTIGHDCR
jgi:hypothetical protein